MKKSSFVAMILSIIGGIFFAIGMCMCLVPDFGNFNQGIVLGVAGLVVLLIMILVWRKMTNKEPIKISGKTIGTTLVGILGAALLGVGMCLVMIWNVMTLGIVIGVVGIVALLMLIPLIKGVHD